MVRDLRDLKAGRLVFLRDLAWAGWVAQGRLEHRDSSDQDSSLSQGQGFYDEVIGIYLSGDSSLSIAKIHPDFGFIPIGHWDLSYWRFIPIYRKDSSTFWIHPYPIV